MRRTHEESVICIAQTLKMLFTGPRQ